VTEEELYDGRPKERASAEGLLVRGLRKVAAADDSLKLDAGGRQAWFLGRVFHRDGYPGEREVVAALGGAVWRAVRGDKAAIADRLREAFRAGEAGGLKEDLQP
jgi:hypothetical protein